MLPQLRRIAPSLLALLLTAAPALSQAAEPVDEEAVAAIRKHGLEHSQVMETLSWITDVYGPRLTGSPNMVRAQQWAMEQLTEWGLENAHQEAWGPFGLGWRLEKFSMNVVGDNPWPVVAFPKAWSPGTGGEVVADVVYFNPGDEEDLSAWEGKLDGKIVLIQSPRDTDERFEADARRRDAENLLGLANAGPPGQRTRRGGRRSGDDDWMAAYRKRQERNNFIFTQKPLALIDRGSKGDYGTIFVSGASVPAPAQGASFSQRPRAYMPMGAEVLPQVTIAVEHYNRMVRLIEKGIPVRIALELETSFHDEDLMEYNVIAEIPGTDPEIGDQVVMLGAHYDSWQSATGCTDNGCGSAVMMEAVRILQEVFEETGRKPRRTIRIALWTGEEQGLLGSRAYVGEHFGERVTADQQVPERKAAHAKLSGYYNLDNGTGRVRGVYLQGNAAVAPIFRAWLAPFADLDARTLSLGNTGGTDHLAFDAVGLPGFQFIQDEIAYSRRTHHSSFDGWDHAIEEDLKQASTIIASFVYHTAQRDELLPRKPQPRMEPQAAGSR